MFEDFQIISFIIFIYPGLLLCFFINKRKRFIMEVSSNYMLPQRLQIQTLGSASKLLGILSKKRSWILMLQVQVVKIKRNAFPGKYFYPRTSWWYLFGGILWLVNVLGLKDVCGRWDVCMQYIKFFLNMSQSHLIRGL